MCVCVQVELCYNTYQLNCFQQLLNFYGNKHLKDPITAH